MNNCPDCQARDDQALIDIMRNLLTRIAVALRGPAPEDTLWGWSDLPERVEALKAAAVSQIEHICEECGGEIAPEHPCRCARCWNKMVGKITAPPSGWVRIICGGTSSKPCGAVIGYAPECGLAQENALCGNCAEKGWEVLADELGALRARLLALADEWEGQPEMAVDGTGFTADTRHGFYLVAKAIREAVNCN